MWPVQRFFDPRFRGIGKQIDEKHAHLAALIDATREEITAGTGGRHSPANFMSLTHALADAQIEMATLVGESLASLRDATEASSEALSALQVTSGHQRDLLRELRASVARTEHRQAKLLSKLQGNEEDTDGDLTDILNDDFDPPPDGTIEDIDAPLGRLLNYAESHLGFAARQASRSNPPVSLIYRPGEVAVTRVSERIGEVPYAIRALSQLDLGSTILDIGAAESTLSVSLATLGFTVTAIDIRPYPLQLPVCELSLPHLRWRHDGVFDAVVCLSTLEHFGRGAYGDSRVEERADLAAMGRVKELTRPGGLFVATVPYGAGDVDELQRTYDRTGLDDLLRGWIVDELAFLRRQSSTVWTLEHVADRQTEMVALITAHRPDLTEAQFETRDRAFRIQGVQSRAHGERGIARYLRELAAALARQYPTSVSRSPESDSTDPGNS